MEVLCECVSACVVISITFENTPLKFRNGHVTLTSVRHGEQAWCSEHKCMLTCSRYSASALSGSFYSYTLGYLGDDRLRLQRSGICRWCPAMILHLCACATHPRSFLFGAHSHVLRRRRCHPLEIKYNFPLCLPNLPAALSSVADSACTSGAHRRTPQPFSRPPPLLAWHRYDRPAVTHGIAEHVRIARQQTRVMFYDNRLRHASRCGSIATDQRSGRRV